MLHFRRAHSLLLDEIEHDTGIELSGARSHRQSVKRSESKRAFDAATGIERAHRSAASEVCDDDAPRCRGRGDLGQAAGDVFIREAVKTIAAHAFRVEP